MTTRDEIFAGCAKANPRPCDPDLCGITGIPCPYCMAFAFQELVAYAENEERKRILAEAEAYVGGES